MTSVSIEQFISSKNYKNYKGDLIIPLGVDKDGKKVYKNLRDTGAIVIAGMTGSGKSSFLHSAIISLLEKNKGKNIKFILIDPKRVEFYIYKNLPQLLRPVIVSPEIAKSEIEKLHSEMDKRFDVLANAGKQNIVLYNKAAKDKMPYIICLIDEISDLTCCYPKEFEKLLREIIWMGRAVGIHLLFSTSRPCKQTLPDTLIGSCYTRIAFATSTKRDSNFILGCPGAEKLLGKGDMMYLDLIDYKPIRLQAPYISDKDIKKIVSHIRG